MQVQLSGGYFVKSDGVQDGVGCHDVWEILPGVWLETLTNLKLPGHE